MQVEKVFEQLRCQTYSVSSPRFRGLHMLAREIGGRRRKEQNCNSLRMIAQGWLRLTATPCTDFDGLAALWPTRVPENVWKL